MIQNNYYSDEMGKQQNITKMRDVEKPKKKKKLECDIRKHHIDGKHKKTQNIRKVAEIIQNRNIKNR